MKNLPHQINQLPGLNEAIRVFVGVVDGGQAVDDDGIVGDALARSGVYAFRKSQRATAKHLLVEEHRKPIGRQGTRTAARELRRFFRLLRFIGRNAEGVGTVSESARALLTLNSPADVPRMHEIWRQALLDLALEDQAGTSHPYRILLHLVAELPRLPKPYSALCLEAADDSADEFARILGIAALPNPRAAMIRIAGKHPSANATKILPALAVQLGDIVDEAGYLTITGWVADALFDPGRAARRESAIRNLVRRPFAPRRRSTAGRRRSGSSGITIRRYDPDLIGARFNHHEDCLDRLSLLLPAQTERFEAIYDLLLVAADTVLLVEAKTIRNDERAQVRIAMGQLYYYEHFDVSPLYPNHEIKRLVLTDRPVTAEVCEFLTEHEIGAIWMPPNADLGGSDLGSRQLKQFGVWG